MSTAYGWYCVTCDSVSPCDMQRSYKKALYHTIELFKILRTYFDYVDKLEEYDYCVELNMIYPWEPYESNIETMDWLRAHCEHEIKVRDEYGNITELERF